MLILNIFMKQKWSNRVDLAESIDPCFEFVIKKFKNIKTKKTQFAHTVGLLPFLLVRD